MPAYERIEVVAAQPKYENSGPMGWGFTLWGDQQPERSSHRQLLERLKEHHPDIEITLPRYELNEDCIEGSLKWSGAEVWIWYEMILDYLYLWSEDRNAVERLRMVLLPLAHSI